jgi:hypothetical protein
MKTGVNHKEAECRSRDRERGDFVLRSLCSLWFKFGLRRSRPNLTTKPQNSPDQDSPDLMDRESSVGCLLQAFVSFVFFWEYVFRALLTTFLRTREIHAGCVKISRMEAFAWKH